jgi:drug/metabolite transporter (DMT)-like permease
MALLLRDRRADSGGSGVTSPPLPEYDRAVRPFQIILAVALGLLLVVSIGIIGWQGRARGLQEPPSTGWNLLGLLVSGVVVGLFFLAVAYFLNHTFAAVLAWTGLVLFFFLGVVIVLINRR